MASQVIVRFGDPGHEIANYAQEINAELIVVSSHGRRGLTRLVDRVHRRTSGAVGALPGVDAEKVAEHTASDEAELARIIGSSSS